MVHLCSRISNDFDIFWKELVPILSMYRSVVEFVDKLQFEHTRPKRAGNLIAQVSSVDYIGIR